MNSCAPAHPPRGREKKKEKEDHRTTGTISRCRPAHQSPALRYGGVKVLLAFSIPHISSTPSATPACSTTSPPPHPPDPKAVCFFYFLLTGAFCASEGLFAESGVPRLAGKADPVLVWECKTRRLSERKPDSPGEGRLEEARRKERKKASSPATTCD